MANMLTYEELTDISQQKRIGIVKTAELVGMTISGFRSAIKNKTLSAEKIMSLCNVLGIDPNTLLGWKASEPGDTIYGNMQKNAKKQIMQISGNEELKKSIEILNAQLEEKDRQIAKLIEKL